MAKGKLSDRQSRMVEFIHNFSEDNGYPPSIREIGEAVGISSTSVVNYNLNRLVEEGYLDRDQNVSRGIRLKDKLGTLLTIFLIPALMTLGVYAGGCGCRAGDGASPAKHAWDGRNRSYPRPGV